MVTRAAAEAKPTSRIDFGTNQNRLWGTQAALFHSASPPSTAPRPPGYLTALQSLNLQRAQHRDTTPTAAMSSRPSKRPNTGKSFSLSTMSSEMSKTNKDAHVGAMLVHRQGPDRGGPIARLGIDSVPLVRASPTTPLRVPARARILWTPRFHLRKPTDLTHVRRPHP